MLRHTSVLGWAFPPPQAYITQLRNLLPQVLWRRDIYHIIHSFPQTNHCSTPIYGPIKTRENVYWQCHIVVSVLSWRDIATWYTKLSVAPDNLSFPCPAFPLPSDVSCLPCVLRLKSIIPPFLLLLPPETPRAGNSGSLNGSSSFVAFRLGDKKNRCTVSSYANVVGYLNDG